MKNTLYGLWRGLRRVSGDDAYERYLAHWRKHHAAEGGQPLDRKAFIKVEQDRKWNGVRRCC
ncbi:MAG: CstA-like transporter-associated (seleno)protein [Pseudomonadota bacterium]